MTEATDKLARAILGELRRQGVLFEVEGEPEDLTRFGMLTGEVADLSALVAAILVALAPGNVVSLDPSRPAPEGRPRYKLTPVGERGQVIVETYAMVDQTLALEIVQLLLRPEGS